MFLKSLIIPQNRLGDFIVCLWRFVKEHKRLPLHKGFNDTLFRIKVSREILKSERQFISDKEFVKDYVKARIGEKFNVPTKAILKTADEVKGYKFEFNDVVKPTHASGLVDIVKNPETINKEKYCEWLKINYYSISREANYKWLTPKIIVEPLIFGKEDVNDVKFFCIKGKVKLIQVDFDRHTNHTRKLYKRNWADTKCSLCYPISKQKMKKPSRLKNMIFLAERLAEPFSFIRVDTYFDPKTNRVAIGELTNCHGSAHEKFFSIDQEKKINRIIFG